MRVHRYPLDIPLDQLVREASDAAAQWDWSRGAFGHALSLPGYHELHPAGRYSYENFPCTGVLRRYPAMSAIFDGFQCEKVSFRLMRRQPQSAYAWHTDVEKGPGVVRLQIPIVSDENAFLVVTDYSRTSELRGTGTHLSEASFAAFARANAGRFTRCSLEPGVLHYFDTTRVHTLVNAGARERITLAFDLVANEWLLERFPAVREELGAGPLLPLSPPGPLRAASAYAQSRLFAVRNRARAWRARAGLAPGG